MAEANGASAAVFFGSSPGELLGDQSPFFPEAAAVVPLQLGRESSTMRKLLPTVYSGPTIVDIETALAMSSKGEEGEPGGRRSPRPAVAVPEKGSINKMENNKYTLRIKCCANGILADDGYKWRKYGQKSIKNSPNPRSYYRCTNPRCSAKKQVERSVEDPDTLVVTYEGLHLHYAYSHFLLPRPRDCSAPPAAAAPDPPAPKRTKSEAAGAAPEAEGTYEEAAPRAPTPESPAAAAAAAAAAGPPSPPAAGLMSTPVQAPPPPQQERVEGEDHVPRRPQGLLEDIVPLLVRKPCSDDNTSTATLSSDDPSFSSLAPYSPPTSFSSTSFSWPHSPSSTYFDQGVLFGTV